MESHSPRLVSALDMSKVEQERMLRATIVTASWFTIALGAAMIAAWLGHSKWLEVAAPWPFHMKFNTAVAFIGGGLGLAAALMQSRRVLQGAGGFLALLGGMTILEYLSGANLGLDELLFKDFLGAGTPYPGRMAPGTSFAFTCAGMHLILAAGDNRRPPARTAAMEILGFMVFALGAEGMAGRVLGIANAYSWGSYAQMSPHTATGFMVLGAGLLAHGWRRQDIRIASVPLWVPGLLCLLVLSFDLSMPRGIATGIAYIPLVFCGLWFSRPHMAFVFAAIATALWTITAFVKPANNIETWTIVLNRSLQFGTLWFVATLVYLRHRSELALRQSEAQLLRHTHALERSNKDLDDFAYIASHDLKEPLRGVSNNAAFLYQDYHDKLDAQGAHRLQRLCHLSQRMADLISDLLYFSRLGRQDLAIQPTDLNATIQDIASLMDTSLSERNATISIPLPLPEIICDKPRVREIFYNLISNSIKYNDSNYRIIEIGCLDNVITNGVHERQVFYVRDNGIGIDEEFHEEIFRIFKRLNDEDDDKKGTGVGLTFVRKIVARHGGRIWLTSERGRGTTFYFTLAPRHSDAAAA